MNKLTTIVMVPVKVEFVIFEGKEIPEVGTITTPRAETIEESILIRKHADSINYPYYRMIGTIGEYTILQKRD